VNVTVLDDVHYIKTGPLSSELTEKATKEFQINIFKINSLPF